MTYILQFRNEILEETIKVTMRRISLEHISMHVTIKKLNALHLVPLTFYNFALNPNVIYLLPKILLPKLKW